jgi:hypothetical protein
LASVLFLGRRRIKAATSNLGDLSGTADDPDKPIGRHVFTAVARAGCAHA